MDEFLTEKEQVQKIREWWRENGPYVIAGLIIGVLGLVGWNYWKAYKIERAEQASMEYQALTSAVAAGNRDEAAQRLASLESEFSATPYIDQGRLMMARLAVENEQFEEAAGFLKAVMNEGTDPELQRVARMRLARVLLASGDPDGALDALELSTAGAFAPRYHELRGDILASRGETNAAREEYDLALAASDTGVVNREAVRMKREALGDAAPAEEAEADS